ncbi:helix-hairpin-helix domain-containing protein [Algoriphagus halophilus]|uniref:Pathogenicity locus n=1 Tax=Algoriphagus halophilus TaxID=226505 RepID=A0A1N6D4Z2_9BACT|nr:helix-hairpin-helix domain-containing protein [Algoriphagus halophilus]SIN65900.1 Pathogenicity locus [Algoriphagus halophilus]
MKKKASPKLNLSLEERTNLRKAKIKISGILEMPFDELEIILNASSERVKTLHALAEFQTVPSIGVKLSEDLIVMGYYSLKDLKEKNGAKLLEEFERKQGYWTDPCVEDQFWLITDYARNPRIDKNWWDYTQERKNYRLENGYPADRPKRAWYEVKPIQWKTKA